MQEKERNSCRMMILCSRELRVSFCPWNTVLCSHSYRVLSVYVCFDLELFRTTWPIQSFSLYRFLLCSLSHGSLLWFTRSHMGFHRWTRCATSVFCLFKGIVSRTKALSTLLALPTSVSLWFAQDNRCESFNAGYASYATTSSIRSQNEEERGSLVSITATSRTGHKRVNQQ